MIKFLIGALLGALLGLGGMATAKTQTVDPDPGSCRGNGDGGYRACRINLEGPAEKVSINVYVDGEFDIGLVIREGPDQRVVSRSE